MMPDIYFDDNYGKLYEKIENGTSKVSYFECEFGRIKNQFILREIPIKIDGETYYDIITPYGYGGPIILDCKEDRKEELLAAYYDYFLQYCNENRIVSEFIRFHPIIANALDFKSIYQIENIRKTVGTNVKDYEDPVQSEFSKSCRKNIRRALNKGVSFKIIKKPSDIANFKQIYFSTMDRNKASEYYYFNDEYFDKCLKYFQNDLLLVEAIYKEMVIAAGFYFTSNKTIHIHLSGTLSEFLYLSPAYILRYAVTLWGKENDYNLIHHGGGRSNDQNDSLYLFKKQFGKSLEFEFYIGKKIWDQKVYDKLVKKQVEQKKIIEETSFFPLYRA